MYDVRNRYEKQTCIRHLSISLTFVCNKNRPVQSPLSRLVATKTVDHAPDTPRSRVGHLPLLELLLVDIGSSASLGDELLGLVCCGVGVVGGSGEALVRQRGHEGFEGVDERAGRRSGTGV